jgi:hypothetical protein
VSESPAAWLPTTDSTLLAAGMLAGIASEIKSETGNKRYRECALEALRLLADNPGCPKKVHDCEGLEAALSRIASDPTDLGMSEKATSIIKALEKHGGGAAAAKPALARKSMFAAATATATKLKTVTIDLTGLIPPPGTPSAKQITDAYTHALLLVPGVTSVSVNTAISRAIVFVNPASENDIRPALLRAVNSVREVQLQQAREMEAASSHSASPTLPRNAAAVYLEEEEEDDFFGDGAVAERRGRETVEERLARQRRATANQSSGEEGTVIGSLAKGVASWMGLGW